MTLLPLDHHGLPCLVSDGLTVSLLMVSLLLLLLLLLFLIFFF